MPVARGNVTFDLSALSTSLAKRTGADEYASDPLPPAGGGSADAPDAETYINTLESKVAGLQDALDDANANWAAVAKERDALREKVEAQEKQLTDQFHTFLQQKAHAQILEKLIMGLVFEPNEEWVKTALAKYRQGRRKRGLRDDLSTERAESSSSSGSEPIDDGQDAVPVPPPVTQNQCTPSLDPPIRAASASGQADEEGVDADTLPEKLEKVLQDLVCKANEMKGDLETEGVYSQFEDLYEDVHSAEHALKINRVDAYPGLVSSLEGQIEEAAKELKEQQKLNKRHGINADGEKMSRGAKGKRRAKGR